MDTHEHTTGVAFLCDQQGRIIKVIRDNLGLKERIAPGQSFPRIVDQESVKKALNFLVELRSQGAAFGWELNVPVSAQVVPLHFAGGVIDDALLIVGGRTSNGVLQLFEEMMRMQNEQVNSLRTEIKERTEFVRTQAGRDSKLYDELSRLNNELANLQHELVKKNVELERLNEQKNRFLGMAAHDLRNPLSAIQIYSEFLLDEVAKELSEEHFEFLSIIHSSGEFMLKLVDDLLDVAKIESGKLELDLWPTDLITLMENTISLNRTLASRKHIALNFEHEGNFPEIVIDGAKIEQVLNNLIGNAIKFSNPHSAIALHVARSTDNIEISVRDEGPGIPADEIDKLFAPFVKTSVQSTGGEKSTGLGLAIVQKIVVEHQGKIWVESEVGKGSIFYVSLPIDSEKKSHSRS